jgi:hypothetical protein
MLMNHLALGLISLVCMLGFPALYFLVRQFRRAGAWMDGTEPPKERVIPYLILNAALGLLVGCLAQSIWDTSAPCRANGGAIVACSLHLVTEPSRQ